MDWPSCVTAISSAVSGATAIALWRVSKATLRLQASVEAAKTPQVNVWYNGPTSLTPKVVSSLSFVNTGQTALPIRTLRILGQDGQATRFLISDELQGSHPKKIDKEIATARLAGMLQLDTDIILQPNIIYQAFFEIQSGQFKIEAMYYDNRFEFLEIDTAVLGGQYILTGKGK